MAELVARRIKLLTLALLQSAREGRIREVVGYKRGFFFFFYWFSLDGKLCS